MIEALVIRLVTPNCAAIMAIIAMDAIHLNHVPFLRETLTETCQSVPIPRLHIVRDIQPFRSSRSTNIHNWNDINYKPPFLVSQAADESHEGEYRGKQRANSRVKNSAKN